MDADVAAKLVFVCGASEYASALANVVAEGKKYASALANVVAEKKEVL
jgi:hypothetical protein